MRHAFTVDVEDWHDGIPISAEFKKNAQRRLEWGLNPLLDLLHQHDVKGTFFLLGPSVQEYPQLIRRIADEGHELGCHGWSHDQVYTMTQKRFRDETERAKQVIEEATGKAVTAYRAAYFSITRASWWALEILADLGFRYDSSIFPIKNWRYGIADFAPKPQRIETPSGPILELPMTVTRRFGRNIPVSGGAYFRLYPYSLTRKNFDSLERAGKPVVFYLHPWELDPSHPKVRFHWKAWMTHYANLRSTTPRLKNLLTDFQFAPLGSVLQEELKDF